MMETTTHHTRRSLACTFCRAKKVRCSGGNPCQNCLEHGETCVVNPRKRKKTLTSHNGSFNIAKKLSDLEDAVHALRGQTLRRDDEGSISEPRSLRASESVNEAQSSSPLTTRSIGAQLSGNTTNNASQQHQIQTSTVSQETPDQIDSLDFRGRDTEHSTIDTEHSSIYSSFTQGAEYHGPHANILSICSRAGIEWIQQKTKVADFQAAANFYINDLGMRLKIQKPMSVKRMPEPSVIDALAYSKAYFESSHDAALGIVHRAWFENRIQNSRKENNLEDDPAWYALRNAIYASGSRILLNQSLGYRGAHEHAWPFFENSLSVHSQLVYWQTTVIGVQAFAVMAYFTEAVSSPILQYMLCSTGLGLAVAKGLHRRPSSSWNLSLEEQGSRARIFWALYCLEKQISSRSGRPSALDDDEINCRLPHASENSTTFNSSYLIITVKLCQLLSLSKKKLSSVEALQKSTDHLIETVQSLEKVLEDFRRSCEQNFGLAFPIDLSSPPDFLCSHQAVWLQSLYNTLVWDVHTPLVFPWYHVALRATRSAAGQSQVKSSMSKIFRASKDAILDAQFIQIDASCPLLSVYVAPLHALVNIFIYALTAGRAEAIDSGLVLLEIGVRYFARVRLETASQVSTPLIKELYRILCHVQKTSTEDLVQAKQLTNTYIGNIDDGNDSLTNDAAHLSDSGTVAEGMELSTDLDINTEFLDIDLETDIETWFFMGSSVDALSRQHII